MIETIKKTLLAGVGAAVVTKEKIESSLDDFVRQGKISAADARIMAEKIASQGKREFDEASQTFSHKIHELLDRYGKETRARLEALETRVRVLEEQSTPPPSRRGEP